MRKKHLKSSHKRLCAVALTSVMALTTAASFGGLAASADTSSAKKYYTDYATYEEEQAAAKELNIEVASEGNVLLKNNGLLPFASNVKRLSVFGTRSDNIQLGGGGSGGGSSAGSSTVKDSLEAAGFKLNPKLVSVYAGISDENEVSLDRIAPAKDSYNLYNDAALIIISRKGQEFSDNATHSVAGHADVTEHYLELDDNEKALIAHVKENFENIVVVINSASPMELGVLEDDPYIDGMVWVGHTGTNGIMALGKILNGEVNPSGKLSDIYPADFKQDPTWFNFGDNSQNNYDAATGKFTAMNAVTGSSKYFNADGTSINDCEIWSKSSGWKTVDYEEGIYYGYRWYETAAETGFFAANNSAAANTIPKNKNGDIYYNRTNGVVYPFGYGLSYTDFTWELKSGKNLTLTKTGDITVKVEVTNVGDVAGKDVVQLYSTPKYYDNGIEKAAANLVDFQKTKLLKPGQSQTLTFTIKPQDLSSFDYDDANGNGFEGYELEAGEGSISLRSDSHTVKDDCVVNYTVPEGTVEGTDATKAATNGSTGFTYTTNVNTGNDVETLFSNGDIYDTTRSTDVTPDAALQFYKRTNFASGAYPTTPVAADLKYSDDALEKLYAQVLYNASDDMNKDYPLYEMVADWSVEEVPENWTQVTEDYRKEHPKAEIQLYDMAGVDYDDAKWTTFMNQLTWDEMVKMVSTASTTAVAAVGKPQTNNADGPAQFSGGTFWTCLVVQASTFNTELCNKIGQMVGNESLFKGVLGWWGPGANIHRSPFSGRNFEYYSQDGIHSGKIAAAVISGSVSKGVHVNIKHCFLNDQETDRDSFGGLNTWCNEQAIREIYIKPFELAIEAGCNGTMTAFNKIGLVSSAVNYNLYVKMLVDEFGFDGISVTDMYADDCSYTWPADLMIRCNIYPLRSYNQNAYGRYIEGTWDASKRDGKGAVMVPDSYTKVDKGENKGVQTWGREPGTTLVESANQYYNLRTHAQKLMYMVANTNLMKNGHDLSEFKGATDLFAPTKVSYNKSIAIDAKTIDSADVKYEITSGSLPQGLTLSSNGNISGTPTEQGTFNFEVTLTVDSYVKSSAQKFTLTVGSPFEVSADLSTASVGRAFSANITSEYITEQEYTVGIAYSLASDSAALPDGMTISSDGKISGTPTAAGTYDIKVQIAASKQGRRGIETTYFYENYTITVNAQNYNVTLNYNYDGAVNTTLVTEGSLSEVAAPSRAGYVFAGWFTDAECSKAADLNASITADTTLYANWMAIVNADEGGSGCSGSIGVGSTLTIVGSLLAVATVTCGIKVAKRKKD